MANTIRLKRASGSDPGASDLVTGELAVRTDTGKLFTKKDDNSVAEIGGGISDVVDDTSPQLGGDLQSNGNDIDFADSDKAIFGTGGDLEIFHDGSHSYIHDAGTGNLKIKSSRVDILNSAGDEDMIVAVENGQVELHYDNSKKLETKSDGIDVTGEVQCDSLDVDGAADFSGGDVDMAGANYNLVWDYSESALEFKDNAKAIFGSSDDLQIFHDASNSYIRDMGTGNLNITGSQIVLANSAFNENMITATENDSVDLFFNGVKKFETASGGVSLTGGAAANVTALSDGATITIDMATACHNSVTLGGNRTFAAPSNQVVGQAGSIFITQDGTGSRTASFNAAFKFVGGTAPTLTTTAAAVDRIDYIILSSNVIHCAVSLDVK